MARTDEWDDGPTPVTTIADPKRTMLEAELQVAKVTLRDVRQKWAESQAEIRKLTADLRRVEDENARLRSENRTLAQSNALLRGAPRKK